jgi:predicted methyltransferase
MKHTPIVGALALGCMLTAGAQQTSLTEEMLQQAAIETPKLVKLLGLQSGAAVADVGAGFGAWMHELSRVVGPSGRVFASEIGTTQLDALRAWVARDNLANVTVVEASVDSTNLPPACCDAVLMRDVYHHLTAPEAVVASLAEALKPGGRLAIIDFPASAGSTVPDGVPADRGGHGVPAAIVVDEVGAVLTHVRTIEQWADPPSVAPPRPLFLVLFRKP